MTEVRGPAPARSLDQHFRSAVVLLRAARTMVGFLGPVGRTRCGLNGSYSPAHTAWAEQLTLGSVHWKCRLISQLVSPQPRATAAARRSLTHIVSPPPQRANEQATARCSSLTSPGGVAAGTVHTDNKPTSLHLRHTNQPPPPRCRRHMTANKETRLEAVSPAGGSVSNLSVDHRNTACLWTWALTRGSPEPGSDL